MCTDNMSAGTHTFSGEEGYGGTGTQHAHVCKAQWWCCRPAAHNTGRLISSQVGMGLKSDSVITLCATTKPKHGVEQCSWQRFQCLPSGASEQCNPTHTPAPYHPGTSTLLVTVDESANQLHAPTVTIMRQAHLNRASNIPGWGCRSAAAISSCHSPEGPYIHHTLLLLLS